MKKYNGFDGKEEYLRHTKKTFYKEGLKCMVLSVVILVLMMLLGIDEMEKVAIDMGFSEKSVMFIVKLITVSFAIGSIAYLISFMIKVTDDE